MQKDPKKIIILEQDPTRKDSLKTILSQEGFIVFSFDSIANCLDNLDQLDADLLLVGSLDSESMMQVINALMATHNRLPLLLMSEDEKLRHILEINQCDHVDIVDAAFDLVMFRKAVHAAINNGPARWADDFTSFLVGNSPQLAHIKQNLKQLSRLKESILITGEIGVGKEIAARAIHHASGQDPAFFIKIDASELNGRNSLSLVSVFKEYRLDITNAEKRPENGNGNKWTLYLDEIGLLPNHLQAELLFVTEARDGYFKVLAGSSQDMEALVKVGHFRKDLFYRLNAFHLKIPALRHRKADIPLLTDFFLYKFCREFDKVCLPVSSRLKEMFMQYNWPGNVRELQDVVKQTLLKGEHHIAFSNHRSQPLKHVSRGMVKPVSKNQIRQAWSQELNSIEQLTNERKYLGQVGEKALKKITWDFMAMVEKKIMKKALNSTNWNRKKAAAMLDISYKSMLNKIKEYKLA
jgi:two-component system response regulator AtoC